MFARILPFVFFLCSVLPLVADTFVVSNSNDSGPGSLRQAIIDANAQTTSDLIIFNIVGGQTITLTSALPEIASPVKIDGWSQTGFQGLPLIEIKPAAGVAADGFRITGAFTAIRGFILNGFQTAVYIAGGLNDLQGCFIGTDLTGTQPAPNDRGIIVAGGSRNLIGGGGLHEGNVVSGNRENGISFVHRIGGFDIPPSLNIVVGNLIGTDRTGMNALPNGGDGVAFLTAGGFPGGGFSSSNRVGGPTSGARNVIAGNLGNGIQLADPGTRETIQGDYIGVAADGTSTLGNAKNGILVTSGSALIGGPFGAARVNAGNVIAFNLLNGISLKQAGGGHFSANSIHDNGTLGIDLGDNGVSPNDSGDGDSGPNALQNFPDISAAFGSNGNLTIYGSLNSSASGDFVLDFYANANADSSGFGEGAVFLGQGVVTTDASGNAAFNVTFPLPANVVSVTATAIQASTGGTSEFSSAVNIQATPPTTPPIGPTYAAPALRPAQLLNLSTRMRVDTGNNVLIGGFIVSGTDAKKIIVRGLGPSLAAFNVPGYLADPVLELYDSSGHLLAANDNWRETQQTEIQNTGLAPSNDPESAIVRTVPPGGYTAIVRGKNDTTGVALVEVYDLAETASYLGDVSTRGLVGINDNVMIAGFISGGNGGGPTTVAVRGLGPSLAAFGITNFLADPTIEIRNGNGTRIQSNNEWTDDQGFDDNRASGFAPPNGHEALVVLDVTPGNYTAILQGTSNGTGVGVLEVYDLR